jgi:hypothetical protein
MNRRRVGGCDAPAPPKKKKKNRTCARGLGNRKTPVQRLKQAIFQASYAMINGDFVVNCGKN